MNHLRKFELENDYLQAKDSFVYPNVSYIVEKDILHYMKNSKYEFVDLGLPSGLKWAKWNVGATKPEESGLYFAWGEDKGYVVTRGELQDESQGLYTAVITNADGTETTKTFAYDLSDYEHYENDAYTKYNGTDGLTTLETEDDGCYLTKKTMRMPTYDDCVELVQNTTSAWTENYNDSGINGLTLTSNTNGNSIFVPAVGAVSNGVLYSFGRYGVFWSSSLYSSVEEAFYSYFVSGFLDVGVDLRFVGIPLRAVRP